VKIFYALVLILLFPVWAHGQVTTMLSPAARQTFFYANGSPIAGGKLCTYAAGTTTPQATYTDSTGLIQASNPIILDGGGQASIWIAGQSYKFILLSPGTDSRCATGTQQWMVDNVSDVAYLNTLQAVLVTGNQTVAGNKTFTGNTTFTGTATFDNGVTFPSINNIVYVGGTVYPQTAAGINAAINSTFGAPIEVVINYPGSYCDTVVNPTNLSLLQFGPGIYQMNIAGVDSTTMNVTWAVIGAGRSQTTIQSCSGANKDVITSQNFSSFTGGSNFYGVFEPNISNITIDGNKSTETQGFCVRLYGRSILPTNVLAENCYQDGIWAEWGGAEADTGPGTQTNGSAISVESDYNGGNGFTFKGSTGGVNGIDLLVAHNNGGWGIQSYTNIQITNVNVFENPSGGVDIKAGGSLSSTNMQCTTATGWGCLFESGSGISYIGGGIAAGGIPFESDSNGGGIMDLLFENAGAGQPCLKFNGGGNYVIHGVFNQCPTVAIQPTSEGSPNLIIGESEQSATLAQLISPTVASQDYVVMLSPTTRYTQFPAATPVNIDGTAGFTLGWPLTTGTLLGTGNGDTHFQYATSAGCTTGSSATNLCATPVTITWGVPFADTSYYPVCTGIAVSSGFPSSPYVVTKSTGSMTVNYAAITSSAAAYSNVTCWAVHN
jgi:hypothetical protein